MRIDDLAKALSTAKQGDAIIYHKGNLASDASGDVLVAGKRSIAWAIGAPNDFMLGGKNERVDMSGFGAGHLVQRRVAEAEYEYMLLMRRSLNEGEIALVVNHIKKSHEAKRRAI